MAKAMTTRICYSICLTTVQPSPKSNFANGGAELFKFLTEEPAMTIYYLTIFLPAGLGYVLTKKNDGSRNTAICLTLSFLLLVFVSSCRYAIGFDYFSYRNIYELANQMSFGEILRLYAGEPLFFLTCKAIGMSGCPYQGFLLVINIFLMAVAMHFIYRHSKMPWLSVYLYITLQFLACNMNLIRQSIATAFFLLAYPSLRKRKLLPFTMFFLIGGLFHNSLFFLYPLYFLLPKKHSKPFLLFLISLTTSAYLFFDPLFDILKPFLPAKYAGYQGSFFWHANNVFYVLFPALYCLLIYLFRNRITDTLLRAICVNSAVYQLIISLFITRHFILERFAIYPFAFSLIAIPEIVSSYADEKRHGEKSFLTYRRVLILFLLFGGAYFTFAAYCGFHHVYPYTGLWDKSISSPGSYAGQCSGT